jgi:hypothetical protein
MALLRSILILLITQVFFVFAQPSVQIQNALSTIKQNEIFENLKFLASDSLKGRSAGSAENNVAAEFIAKKFIEYGLKPAGNVSSLYQVRLKSKKSQDPYLPEEYFQKFSFIKSKLSDNNSLKICKSTSSSQIEISFPYRKDFIIQVNNLFNDLYIKAPVVFAGYGIDKGENNYSDYVDEKGKQVDVKNKIVLIVDGFPQENNPESSFSKSKNALYRNPLRKMEVAQKLGALAVLVVNSPLKNEPPFNVKYESRIKAYENPSFHLPVQVSNSIPIVFISENVAYEIFKDSNTNIKDLLQKIDKNLKGNAFELPSVQIELQVSFDKEIINTQNVVGIIEGNDEKLKDEFIVIGAHYDHVGFGYYGAMNKSDIGQIHNGADDNASGTSALIELAEAFSVDKPKRSLLFIAFSGEENGLLGSRFFVNYQPMVPLEKIVSMFNFDMVGRNEQELLWIGGAFYSDDLRKIIERANTEVGFELLYNVGLLNFASDQAPFLKKEIPSAFFFSGLHDDYHTPKDDYDKIDYDKLSKVVRLGFLAIESLANSDFKPAYKELSIEERKSLVDISMQKQKKYRTVKNMESEEIEK